MTAEDRIQAVVRRLQRIAKENNDEFKYSIDIVGARFEFACIETSDQHDFVTGSGNTIEAMLKIVERNIPGALSAWSYSETE